MMSTMTVAAAVLLAQVIPALLVAGLLGPLILGFRMQQPERFFFASQVITVVIAEAACLYYAALNEPMPPVWAAMVILACTYLLMGIIFTVSVWAKRTEAERSEEIKAKSEKAQRRKRRREERQTPRSAVVDASTQHPRSSGTAKSS